MPQLPPTKKISRRKFLKITSVAALGLGVTQVPCAYCLEVNHAELRLPRWDADGFRVALLSDFHADGSRQAGRAAEAARLAVREDPDVILFGGDFISHRGPDAAPNLRKALEPFLEARCPCFAVLGNHDYVADPMEVATIARHSHMKMLRNQVAEVQGVSIAGLDDGLFGLERPQCMNRSLSRSLLALFHEPDYVTTMPSHVSLQLSGHSHGGQICLPFGVPLVLRTGAKEYVEGFYPDAHVPLFVSKGVGTIGIDYRAFCRPEINILTLRAGDGDTV